MSEQSDTAIKFLNNVTDKLEFVVKYATEVAIYAENFRAAALGMFDAAADKLNNPPTGGVIGSAECIDCVKTLAPMQKIAACLAGGGAAFVLWGMPSQIANAQLMRVTKVFSDHIIAKPVVFTQTLAWSEGRAVELAKPDKYILRIMLLPRLSG